jgi:hypothetical protein
MINVVRQPEDYALPGVGLGQQTYVYALLPKKVVQFLLPAPNTVGIPAGEPRCFGRCPSRPCCHTRL